MSNERFGNINRIPEATGKSVWGWYTEPEQVTEEKRWARAMTESLAATHEHIASIGGLASSGPAYTVCAGCMYYMQTSHCAGCIRKYRRNIQ